MSDQTKQYEEMMKLRAQLRGEADEGSLGEVGASTEDDIGMDASREARLEQAQEAPQTQDNKSGKLSAAGDTVTAGGAAAGNPYVAGAGLALKTVGMVDDAHRQAEQSKIDAYNKKIMAQRSAIRNFFA